MQVKSDELFKQLLVKAEALIKQKTEQSDPEVQSDVLSTLNELQSQYRDLNEQNRLLVQSAKEDKKLAFKYEQLYKYAPGAQYTLNKQGQIKELNISAEKLLNAKRNNLLNSYLEEYISGKDQIVFKHFLKETFDQNHAECEIQLLAGDNVLKWTQLSSVVVKNKDLCNVCAININHLKKDIEKLTKKKEKAEKFDHLKSAFIANMSHEIRTPMNGILGFTEMLKDPDLSPEDHDQFVSIIEKSGAHMLKIINDIVNISKIESGQVVLILTETNINEQIKYIYDFFKPEAKQRNLSFKYHAPLPDEQSIITTDQEKVYAVLTNLVKNALKFTRSGFIEVGYNLKGEFLEFYVKDSGCGISTANQKIVFERFKQSRDSFSKNFEGSGLGLSISKAYIEMMGGNIRLESKINEGSTFFFTIPYKRDKQKEKD